MDNFGDLFGGLGEMLGDMLGVEAVTDGAEGIGEMFSRDSRGERGDAPIVYERYLCGGPRTLHINDR